MIEIRSVGSQQLFNYVDVDKLDLRKNIKKLL